MRGLPKRRYHKRRLLSVVGLSLGRQKKKGERGRGKRLTKEHPCGKIVE